MQKKIIISLLYCQNTRIISKWLRCFVNCAISKFLMNIIWHDFIITFCLLFCNVWFACVKTIHH